MKSAKAAPIGGTGKLFTGRVIGSIATFSVISSICLIWLVTLVIEPLLTTPIDFSTLTGFFSFGFDLLITVLILIAFAHNALDLMTTAALRIRKPKMDKTVPRVKRFGIGETIQHLTLIATTAISALTGYTLM